MFFGNAQNEIIRYFTFKTFTILRSVTFSIDKLNCLNLRIIFQLHNVLFNQREPKNVAENSTERRFLIVHLFMPTRSRNVPTILPLENDRYGSIYAYALKRRSALSYANFEKAPDRFRPHRLQNRSQQDERKIENNTLER